MKKIRFRLATLFCFLTVGCILLGYHASAAHRQHALKVQLWQQVRGRVIYDGRSGTCCADTPDWLANLLGKDVFCRVTQIDLQQADLTLDDIDLMKKFPHVDRVSFAMNVQPTQKDRALLEEHFPWPTND